MYNYEIVYRKKQHYVTIPQRHTRKLFFGNEHLQKLLKHQKSNENFFITKYAEDGIVSCVILDFDDEDKSHSNAYKDARRLQKFTARKGLNTVIVSSTNKGYHTYIQLPPRYFGKQDSDIGVDRDVWFNKFVEHLIKPANSNFKYKTLDSTNTSAGLRGNIRVIGSVHPKTQERVHIEKGEFLDFVEPCDWEWNCMQKAFQYAENKPMVQQAEQKEIRKKLREKELNGQELIDQNDLRILMPSIFGGETKSFKKGYIMMNCPFHSDANPSMVVEKDYYFCKSCGAKGNWWTLYRLGKVHLPKKEFIRIKTGEKVKI